MSKLIRVSDNVYERLRQLQASYYVLLRATLIHFDTHYIKLHHFETKKGAGNNPTPCSLIDISKGSHAFHRWPAPLDCAKARPY